MKEAVVLKYVGPKTKDWEIVTQLGNGKVSKISFNEKNDFTVEVPIELTFLDPFRKINVVQIPNYPLHLLNSYGPKSKFKFLEFIEKKEYPDFVKDPLSDFKKEEGAKEEEVVEKKDGRKKKEKQNEV